MKIVRALLVLVAIGLSAFPVLWMAVLSFAQFGNLSLNPPYWHEFACAVAFWVGLAAAMLFARRCFVGDLSVARSPFLIALIVVGVVGGIAEEVILWNNAKPSFPIGYFELAPLAWVIVGLIALKLPNPLLNTDARQVRPRAG